VAAHVEHNPVPIGDVGELVQRVHQARASFRAAAPEEAPETKQPTVSARSTVKPDYIVCMQCGTKHKMLKHHLQNGHDVTPANYRNEFGLSWDYPMVAPEYSDRRRALAHAAGFGRKRDGSIEARPKKAAADRSRGRFRKVPEDPAG
jgi:predicted transcriptional regulator